MEPIKAEIVKYAKLLEHRNLVIGTTGNISVRIQDRMFITPSAVPYEEMTEADILEVDIFTRTILSGSQKPSSETPMHSFIYSKNSRVDAIVHTHSKYATIFACANMPIPPVHYIIADIGREVAVAPYAPYGTKELADNAVAALKDSNGILLANHGVLAVGSSLKDAFRRAEVIEEVAHLAYGSFALNQVKPLNDEQMTDALSRFSEYVS